MTGTSGLTAADVMALTKDSDGSYGGWFWIVILFIFVFAFGGGNLFGNTTGNYVTQAELQAGLYNQTTNSNLMDIKDAITNGTQTAIVSANTTDKEILQNRYDNSLQTQTLSSQLSTCCCNNQLAIANQTNDLITQMNANTQSILDKMCEQEIQSLRDQLTLAEMASANSVQTQNLLGNLGRWVPYAGYNGCGCSGTYYNV